MWSPVSIEAKGTVLAFSSFSSSSMDNVVDAGPGGSSRALGGGSGWGGFGRRECSTGTSTLRAAAHVPPPISAPTNCLPQPADSRLHHPPPAADPSPTCSSLHAGPHVPVSLHGRSLARAAGQAVRCPPRPRSCSSPRAPHLP
ncbi:unnamed protein product [Urochloa humidicola]